MKKSTALRLSKCGTIIYKLTINTAGSMLLRHVVLISMILINNIAFKGRHLPMLVADFFIDSNQISL